MLWKNQTWWRALVGNRHFIWETKMDSCPRAWLDSATVLANLKKIKEPQLWWLIVCFEQWAVLFCHFFSFFVWACGISLFLSWVFRSLCSRCSNWLLSMQCCKKVTVCTKLQMPSLSGMFFHTCLHWSNLFRVFSKSLFCQTEVANILIPITCRYVNKGIDPNVNLNFGPFNPVWR